MVATTLLMLLAAGGALQPASAQEGEEEETQKKWTHEAEVGIVATSGNSNSTTLGVGDRSIRKWGEKALLTLKLEATRVEIQGPQFAVCNDPVACDPADFTVRDGAEIVETERYLISGKYDYSFSEIFFAYAFASWDRDRPSGIDNRYIASLGVGNRWVDSKKILFKTNYGLSYTDQRDVIPNSTVDSTYAGGVLASNFKYDFAESASYSNDAALLMNLSDTEQYLATMTNALTVSINTRLAVKVGLRWDYNNLPPLGALTLFSADPTDPGSVNVGVVLVPKEKLDTTFTTSLVINF